MRFLEGLRGDGPDAALVAALRFYAITLAYRWLYLSSLALGECTAAITGWLFVEWVDIGA